MDVPTVGHADELTRRVSELPCLKSLTISKDYLNIICGVKNVLRHNFHYQRLKYVYCPNYQQQCNIHSATVYLFWSKDINNIFSSFHFSMNCLQAISICYFPDEKKKKLMLKIKKKNRAKGNRWMTDSYNTRFFFFSQECCWNLIFSLSSPRLQ